MTAYSHTAIFALLVLALLALLIGYGARSLASGLTGSLALAATTFNGRLLQILLVNGLDMLHMRSLRSFSFLQYTRIPRKFQYRKPRKAYRRRKLTPRMPPTAADTTIKANFTTA